MRRGSGRKNMNKEINPFRSPKSPRPLRPGRCFCLVMKTNTVDYKPVLSISKIKERGWTETMVRKFLGDPDGQKENPFYRKAAPMKVYLEERVIAAEQTLDFIAAQQKLVERKIAADKAVQTKKEKAMAFANSIEITIPVMPWDEVLKNAIKSYNDFHSDLYFHRGYDFTPADTSSDPDFLARICTNNIRHECTNYEHQIHRMFGKVGVQEAHDIIQKRINEKILQIYPQITAETLNY